MIINTESDTYQEDVWEEFQKSGSVLIQNGDHIDKLVSLMYWRESNEGFLAGYKYERGNIYEVCNIPEEELEKIAPGLGVMWNSAEAFHSKDLSNGEFTDSEIEQIDEAFRKAGFEVEIDCLH